MQEVEVYSACSLKLYNHILAGYTTVEGRRNVLFTAVSICVNSISPGGFDKGDLPEEFVRLYSEETPLGRMGIMGEDIKGAALLLATPAGDYITGTNIVVDGGFSIWK